MGVPKCATVTHFFSQRGAVGACRSGLAYQLSGPKKKGQRKKGWELRLPKAGQTAKKRKKDVLKVAKLKDRVFFRRSIVPGPTDPAAASGRWAQGVRVGMASGRTR